MLPANREPLEGAVLPVGIYNERKIKGVLAGIPEVPEKYTLKKKRPQELAQVRSNARRTS